MSDAKIQIRQVSKVFKGQGSEVQALQDVSLDIQPNEFITFVGASGCGKSTFIYLLERFYDCQGGSILIDGMDISAVPQRLERAV